MLRTSPLLSGACGLEGLGSTLKGLFDLWLEDVIRIKIEQRTNLHARAASVDIALQRGEGNGLRHRAGMTLPPALHSSRWHHRHLAQAARGRAGRRVILPASSVARSRAAPAP